MEEKKKMTVSDIEDMMEHGPVELLPDGTVKRVELPKLSDALKAEEEELKGMKDGK